MPLLLSISAELFMNPPSHLHLRESCSWASAVHGFSDGLWSLHTFWSIRFITETSQWTLRNTVFIYHCPSLISLLDWHHRRVLESLEERFVGLDVVRGSSGWPLSYHPHSQLHPGGSCSPSWHPVWTRAGSPWNLPRCVSVWAIEGWFSVVWPAVIGMLWTAWSFHKAENSRKSFSQNYPSQAQDRGPDMFIIWRALAYIEENYKQAPLPWPHCKAAVGFCIISNWNVALCVQLHLFPSHPFSWVCRALNLLEGENIEVLFLEISFVLSQK